MKRCTFVSTGAAVLLVLAGCASRSGPDVTASDVRAPTVGSSEFALLEADSLQSDSVGYGSALDHIRHGSLSWMLRDSSSLHLSPDTPKGRYLLADGGTLIVAGMAGRRMNYTHVMKPVRVLWFSLRCTRLAGLVIRKAMQQSEEADSSFLKDYFEPHRSWLGGSKVSLEALPLRLVIPSSWFARAKVELPDDRTGQLELVWLSYDPPDPAFGPESPLLPERPPAIVRAEQRLPQPSEDAMPNGPCTECPIERHLRARVIGSATVDLATGKVVRRSGAVR